MKRNSATGGTSRVPRWVGQKYLNEFDAPESLYESYTIMNRICWQGTLPPCRLQMSHRLAPSTAAFAGKRGQTDLRIVFNAAHCPSMNDTDLLQVMAHEMIHIWQYSRGRRGGHGRDFRSEQLRLGLVLGQVIAPDSPMGYVFFLHRLKNLHPAEAARRAAACRDRRGMNSTEISSFKQPEGGTSCR